MHEVQKLYTLTQPRASDLSFLAGPPAKLLRSVMVQVARDIEQSKQQHGSVVITIVNKNNGESCTVKADIEIVHASWSLELFGAIIEVEHLPCKLGSGEGSVDMLINLYEVSDHAQISESMLRVSTVDPFNGQDIDQFIRDFCQAFVSDWNA